MMKYEILFITDNSQEYFSYRLPLESEGNIVNLRSNVSETLLYLEHHSPSIVIIDYDVPCVSAQNLEAMDILCNKDIPIIIIVEDIDDETLIECMDEYSVIVMKKPVHPNELIEEINLLLDTWRTHNA